MNELIGIFLFGVPVISIFAIVIAKAVQFERNRTLWRNPGIPGVHGEFPRLSFTRGRVEFMHFEQSQPKGGTTWGETYRIDVDAPWTVTTLEFQQIRTLLGLTPYETDVTDPEFQLLLQWFFRRGLEVRMRDRVLIAIGSETASPENAVLRMEQLEALAKRAEALAQLARTAPLAGTIESQLRR